MAKNSADAATPGAGATQEPPPPPTLPCDPGQLYKFSCDPSEYAKENQKLHMILYNRIHESILEKAKADNFDGLQTFHGANPLESIQEIVETVDSQDYSQLVSSKKKILNDFVSFLRQKIPIKTATSIAHNWIPIIAKTVPQVESVLHLIVRMANMAQDGNKILFWLSNTLFPKSFSKKSALMNSKVGAVCRCIVPPSRRAYWAILDTNKTFKLYLLKKNLTLLEFECKVSRTKVHEDGRSVVIYDEAGNEVKTFLPVDINQAQMWGAALAKQHAPFPYYLSSFQTPLPPEYYHALYEAYTCPDLIILRCVTHPSVTPANESTGLGHLLMDSLFDIFAHDSKMTLLLNEMIAIDLYGDVKSKEFLKKPTNCGNLINVFVERFGKAYYDKFVSKLIDYVSSKDCFGAGLGGNASDLEIPLNTAMKLIYSSGPLVPKELKHVAQVIFGYTACKYNTKQDTYACVASFFFFRCLLSIMKNTEIYGGQASTSKNIKGFIEIAKVAFSFGDFPDGLSDLNNRFQHNVYPRLEQFIFSISEFTTKIPNYDGVSKERFVQIIENVLLCISRKSLTIKEDDAFIQFVQRFNDAALPNSPEPLVTPPNLHLVLSLFFNYRIDTSMVDLSNSGEDLDANQNYFAPAEVPPEQAPMGGMSDIPVAGDDPMAMGGIGLGGFQPMPNTMGLPPLGMSGQDLGMPPFGGDMAGGFPQLSGIQTMGLPPMIPISNESAVVTPQKPSGSAKTSGAKGKASAAKGKPSAAKPSAAKASAAKGKPSAAKASAVKGKAPPKKAAAPAVKPALPGKKPAAAAKGKPAPAKKAPVPAKKAAAPAKKAAAPAKKAAAPAKKPPPKKAPPKKK